MELLHLCNKYIALSQQGYCTIATRSFHYNNKAIEQINGAIEKKRHTLCGASNAHIALSQQGCCTFATRSLHKTI